MTTTTRRRAWVYRDPVLGVVGPGPLGWRPGGRCWPAWDVAADQLGTAAELLAGLPDDVERVMVCGRMPAGGWDSWATQAAAAGWSWSGWADPERPRIELTRAADGRRVQLRSAAEWYGTRAVHPAAVAHAHELLAAGIRWAFASPGEAPPKLLGTPGQTGAELLLRTLPRGRSFPVLPAELREAIRSGSPQGRVQHPGPDGPELVPGFAYLDLRWAYAALVTELPGELVTRDELPEPAPRGTRARYRVRFRVPAEWAHLGVLPVKAGRSGWAWPDEPGYEGEAWCDGAELELAQAAGWDVRVLERVLFARGRPADTWAGKLVELRRMAESSPNVPAPIRPLVLAAVRAILLHTVGTWHARSSAPPPVTVTGPAGDPGTLERALASRSEVRELGELLAWTEPAPQRTGAAALLEHPEWSAAVYARCHRRLLVGRGRWPAAEGAWALRRDQVLGLATDALYATVRPDWPDDGRPGSWTVKGYVPGPLPRPRNREQLWQLRDRAESQERGQ